MKTPTKLTVVMLNTWETSVRLQHENQLVPYTRRTVTIELTPEQIAQLKPRKVGQSGNLPMYETIGEHWLEQEPQESK